MSDVVVGLLSDTHGLMRPEALAALRGCDLILHAGDVGSEDVLVALRGLAPLHAVRGNNDRGVWAARLPASEVVEISGRCIYLLHDRHELDLEPAAAGFDVVVSGHSHRPLAEVSEGVLFVNPGSAGPRRFRLPIGVARLRLGDGRCEAELVELRV
jgi:uncharacterized protein